MEREKFCMNNESLPTWSSCNYVVDTQSNDLNYEFFNPNWETSMDQNDPFESALSSIVSSPAVSNGCGGAGDNGGDLMIRELIGRLGNITGNKNNNHNANNIKSAVNSTNTSCYSTPLNSPPKLNLSSSSMLVDNNPTSQMPCIGRNNHFGADPGFVERAARFSCFGRSNNESELMVPKLEPISNNMKGVVVNYGSYFNNSEKCVKENVEAAGGGDSREESTVSEQREMNLNANARKRKAIPRGKAKESASPALSAATTDAKANNDESNAKRSKIEETKGGPKEAEKAREEPKNGNQKQSKENSKPEPPKDYIHVRARRGQATDSHSLAERVRREKISERMKFLQDLVPGCNKVTGKAVMLDEIINYVQSLQRQVEFLSMKLATVNPRMEFNMETFLSKDIFQSRGSLPQSLYPLDASTPGFPFGYQQHQQGLAPLHGNLPSNTAAAAAAAAAQFSMSADGSLRNPGTTHVQLPPVNRLGEANAIPQGAFWEDDLHSVVQMGFGQNQPEGFHGSLSAAQ